VLLRATDLRFSYPATTPVSRRARESPAGASSRAYTIDGVSLDVAQGAIVGILGPNGSGKTTLMKLLAGRLRPSEGRVTLSDAPIASYARTALAQRLAIVPQETELAFDYSVLEMVLMGRYAHLGAFEIEGPDDLAAADRALDATGMRSFATRPFRTLSGGEKQRVVIASALAQLDLQGTRAAAAPLLVLDEPTASLDLKYQLGVAALLKDLRARLGLTSLLSTHDLHFARNVCTEIVLLSSGRILARGTPASVLTTDAISALYDVDAALIASLVV
jgi:iron complex transport system ATP-binding protein